MYGISNIHAYDFGISRLSRVDAKGALLLSNQLRCLQIYQKKGYQIWVSTTYILAKGRTRPVPYSKSSFTMDILDDARSFPSLWRVTQAYLRKHPDSLHPDAKLDWILSDEPVLPSDRLGDREEGPLWKDRDYNGCQFFSNFESKKVFFDICVFQVIVVSGRNYTDNFMKLVI